MRIGPAVGLPLCCTGGLIVVAARGLAAGALCLELENGSRSDLVVRVHAAPRPPAAGAVSGDWPTLLGPSHDNKSPETKLLVRWPEGGPTLVWEMEAGEGFAVPTIAGGRLLFFHRIGDRERVECLDPETGGAYWSFGYPTAYRDRYGFNNGPRCGPVIDGGRVYTHGAEGKLHCLDLNTGKVIWKHDTSADFNVPQNYFGVGSSPLVHEKLLIVNVGAPSNPCVVAFDKTDGHVVWKAGGEWTAGYATPVPAMVHGRPRILVFAGGDSRPPTGGLMCIDPASGKVDFQFPFRSSTYESVNASSPVFADNGVFISSSYGTGGVKLRLGMGGGHVESWWTEDLGAHFATPAYKDGYVYGITGRGKSDAAFVCLDYESGRTMWRFSPEWKEIVERGGRHQEVSFSTYLGSMIHADGRFLILGELGHLLRANLTPERFELLQRTRLFHAPETFTPPVISRGLLYVRQNRPDTMTGGNPRLLCYDLRGAG